MSKLTKKMSLSAETDIVQMTDAYDELRRALLATEPSPETQVKLSISLSLPVGVQQRLDFDPVRRDKELAAVG